MLAKFLRLKGHECYTSNDGRNGLALLNSKNFDVVLLDLAMPEFTGFDVIEQLYQSGKIKENKIILFTAAAITDEGIWELFDKGVYACIRKPIELSSIIRIIEGYSRHKIFSYSTYTKLSEDDYQARKTERQKTMRTDHILASYDTEERKITEAIGFLKDGIQNNESAIFLIRKGLDVEDLKSQMRSNGIAVDSLLAEKSLFIIENEKWYMPDKKVDKARILKQWEELINACLKNGKKGVRAFGMADCFFENDFVKDLLDYESSLPEKFNIHVTGICAYKKNDIGLLSDDELKKLKGCHGHVWLSQ